MNFKAKQFCIDYNIPYWESGNNVSPGWINITCPMCGDKSSHGGINPNGGYYHCWRCGGHALKQIIKTLLNISYFEVEKIVEHETREPDLTFRVKGKLFAIEIETGTLLRKKDQLEKKIKDLNGKYKNRWLIVVSKRELVNKYSSFGLCTQRKWVCEKLEKMAGI